MQVLQMNGDLLWTSVGCAYHLTLPDFVLPLRAFCLQGLTLVLQPCVNLNGSGHIQQFRPFGAGWKGQKGPGSVDKGCISQVVPTACYPSTHHGDMTLR